MYLLQSEKLTKREVEAKFCNFSLSTNSVSVRWAFEPSVKIISPAATRSCSLININISPPPSHPVADAVQVHRAEGESAGPGATADITHQTEDRCHPAGQAGPEGPGGAHGASSQTGS